MLHKLEKRKPQRVDGVTERAVAAAVAAAAVELAGAAQEERNCMPANAMDILLLWLRG